MLRFTFTQEESELKEHFFRHEMAKFYTSVWDPFLIICQIFTMQSVFYLSLGVFLVVFGWLGNVLISLDQFLSFEEITVHTSSGLVTIFSFLACSIVGYVTLSASLRAASNRFSKGGDIDDCGGEGEKVFRFCCYNAHHSFGDLHGLFWIPNKLAVVVVDAIDNDHYCSAGRVPMLET